MINGKIMVARSSVAHWVGCYNRSKRKARILAGYPVEESGLCGLGKVWVLIAAPRLSDLGCSECRGGYCVC